MKQHLLKKLTGILISISMAFSFVALMPLKVSADTSDFTYENGVLTFLPGFCNPIFVNAYSLGLSPYSVKDLIAPSDLDYTAVGLVEEIIDNSGSIDSVLCDTIGSDSLFINLTKISLPFATCIDIYALKNCQNLTSVYLPNVTTIGSNAFSLCTGLTSLSLPNATTIKDSAFQGCTGLTSLSLPNATTIQGGAFNGCTGLTSLSLPNATTIGDNAFQDCTGLTSLSLPNATSFGIDCFDGCNSLKTLIVSDTLDQTLLGTLPSKTKVYTVSQSLVSFTTTALANGHVGKAYNQQIEATTGSGLPITYSLLSGTLPDGIILSSDGTISGIPTTTGTYTFDVTASNSLSSTTQSYTITITYDPFIPFYIGVNVDDIEDIAAGEGACSEMDLID